VPTRRGGAHDAGGRTGLPLSLLAAFLVEFIMQIIQRAVIAPALQIAVDRAAWRQVAGDVAPCATSAEHIHDTVDDLLSMAGRNPRLSGARRLTVCSDVGFPDSMRLEGVSEIDDVIASRWSPPVRR
jgi:hypothetical protein